MVVVAALAGRPAQDDHPENVAVMTSYCQDELRSCMLGCLGQVTDRLLMAEEFMPLTRLGFKDDTLEVSEVIVDVPVVLSLEMLHVVIVMIAGRPRGGFRQSGHPPGRGR